MAIEYAGGTIVRTTVDGTSNTNFLSQLNAAMVSAGWTSTPVGADYHLVSVTTPDGLNMRVRLTESSVTYAAVGAYDQYDVPLGGQEMYIGAGTTYECLATRYTLWLWLPGIVNALPPVSLISYGTSCAVGVPFLPDPVKPLYVQAASNTTPIEITTTTPHGINSGESVYITGVLGNTGANGSFTITSTGASTFTLTGSIGTGAYTSGGLVGTTARISRALYVTGSDGASTLDNSSWRRDPFQTIANNPISSYSGVMLNAFSTFAPGMTIPLVQPAAYPWRNTRSVIVEPLIYASSATQAQVYGAVVIRGTPVPPIDTTFTMDGHSWVIYGVGGTNSALAIAVD